MRLMMAFVRATFHTAYIYRVEFWVRLLSSCIMMYAVYSLWNILYTENPAAFGMNREQMTTYGVLGIMLAPVLESAGMVQYYISEHVRQGTLEMDLLKPLHFVYHMFHRHLGVFLVTSLLQGLPAFLIAVIFLDFKLPRNPGTLLAFGLSVFLGYLIFLAVGLLLGLLSIITLKIESIDWAVFSLVRLASGQLIPLWMFPPLLGAIAAILPFKNVYFVPMTIYIEATDGPVTNLILSQLGWTFALFMVVLFFWHRVQVRITVQGG